MFFCIKIKQFLKKRRDRTLEYKFLECRGLNSLDINFCKPRQLPELQGRNYKTT